MSVVSFGEELIAALEEAVSYAEGLAAAESFRVHRPLAEAGVEEAARDQSDDNR
jgi:hypothetical protein